MKIDEELYENRAVIFVNIGGVKYSKGFDFTNLPDRIIKKGFGYLGMSAWNWFEYLKKKK